MEREDVCRRAVEAGRRLTEALGSLPGVVGVRGLGLLLAAELAPGIDARRVAGDALAAGLVVNAVTPSALRLAPSLLVDEAEIAEAVEVLGRVLAAHVDAERAVRS
jgi:acetylornithine aminotransferase